MLITAGKYPVCLYIDPGDSMEIISDPALSGPYRANLITPLKYLVKAAQTRTIIEKMLSVPDGDIKSLIDKTIEESAAKLPSVRESYAGAEHREIRPTAIQNIVPGFILFAMFFIVIPLAASIIIEKNEGAFQRLRTLPVGFGVILGSKVLVYFMVCLVQFFLMMLVGLWIFPHFFGLPRLQIGNNFAAILFATIASSLAAIGFGILVGSASGTIAQASLFGSVMVVLLGVISGTFLPVYVMPQIIQSISLVSPMRWGIDNYLDVFIRGGGILSILPRSMLLFTFFIFAMICSINIFAVRKS
jgi:ABC-2 type transport system permease protein